MAVKTKQTNNVEYLQDIAVIFLVNLCISSSNCFEIFIKVMEIELYDFEHRQICR